MMTKGLYSSLFFRCTIRDPAGTFSVTQILPPTVAPLPIVTRPKIVALEYTMTSSSKIGWRGMPLMGFPLLSSGKLLGLALSTVQKSLKTMNQQSDFIIHSQPKGYLMKSM